jgi:hypothetical protein
VSYPAIPRDDLFLDAACRRIFDVAERKLFTGRVYVGAVKE